MKVRELNKPGNAWCAHCTVGTGCTIYDTRPESCRDYECFWLKTQAMDKPLSAALRPDKSRVVIGTANRGEDLILYVSPERPDAWKSGEFGRFVGAMKKRGVAVLVSCSDVLTRI
jgi:hypothetical protein